MASFKVGQRVRVVAVDPDAEGDHLLGCEGTISARKPPHLRGFDWAVAIDGMRCNARPDGCYVFDDRHLAPLTDPKADAFVESVKKWKPEPEAPKVPDKVRA